MICGLCQLYTAANNAYPKGFAAGEIVGLMVGSFWMGQANSMLCKTHHDLLDHADGTASAVADEPSGVVLK